MNIAEREVLIENIGIEATEKIVAMEQTISALADYLKVVKICSVKGYKFVEDRSK